MIEDCEEYKYNFASQMAGEYIEELGKTDLVTMSREEWLGLMHVIIKNYAIAPPF